MTNRRILTSVTLVALLALLVVAAVVGWRSISAPLPGSAEPTEEPTKSDCVEGVQVGDTVRTKDVTVSVFNAGDRAGLAGQTQDELVARGFIAGDVGNAPGTLAKVRFVRVLAPSKKDPAATLVARQFGKRTFIQVTDLDLGPGVDIVVGDDYLGLVKAKKRIKAKTGGSGC